MLLLSQRIVFSSELLHVQGRQSGSILEALLYPLLHTDDDRNKNTHYAELLQRGMGRRVIVDSVLVGVCVLSDGREQVPLPALLIFQLCVFFSELGARRF